MSTTRGARRGERWALGLAVLVGGCPSGGEDDDGSTTASSTLGDGATDTSGSGTRGDGPSTSDATTTDSTDDGPLDGTGTDGGTDTDDTTSAGADCGNGSVDPGEACDDGNDVDADGCNTDCTVSGSVLWFHNQASGMMQTDEFYSVAVDDQGRAYAVGNRFGTNQDFWIQQYTEDDALGWSQVIDGGAGDGARGAVISGSTLFVTGYTAVAGQSNNVWFRGFGLDGSVGLTIAYNGVASGSDVGEGIARAPDGNLVVTGYEAVLMAGSNVWTREYTPAGAAQWTAGYGNPALSNDRGSAVAVDAMGNVAVAGFHTVSGQGRDVWMRVYDTAGAPLWTQTYGGPAALDDEALGVAFDAEGNVIVVGYESDPVIPWRMFLRKYDPTGMELWSQPWEGQLDEGARGFGVAVDQAGDIVLTGQHRNTGVSQLLVRKLDPDGNERWTTLIDGAPMTGQVGRGVTIGPDDRIWVVGGVDFGVDGRDAYIARLAP